MLSKKPAFWGIVITIVIIGIIGIRFMTNPETKEQDKTASFGEETKGIESLPEEPEQPQSTVYESSEYGLRFSLPESWDGYTIVVEEWEGLSISDQEENSIVETGPVINIRHPLWTSQRPRQDIPIMIFTIEQWDSLRKDEFSIGAAPIGPSELGRNSKYVFALPARYNYSFPEGYEEVEEILEENPLESFENADWETSK